MYLIVFALAINFIVMSRFVIAPPSPHGVQGIVYSDSGINGVPNGLPVTINDTVSEDFTTVYVDGIEELPGLWGSYSGTITGDDGDTVIVMSWNQTHYGTNSSALASGTTDLNIVLNTTRPSEENVTIVFPANNSILNKTVIFSFFANISILGGDGVDCNASINFTDRSIINISDGEKPVHPLSNITS
ncbi:MAG TPA: hypothetical protein VJI97_04860, partial [Candidatus Nanoarchaeia archaeon]|nr:hypothetical protein [Candidatus Nanoarchaeia archaeon]